MTEDWFDLDPHPHYGPCDGFANGNCSECRRVIWALLKERDGLKRAIRAADRCVKENEGGDLTLYMNDPPYSRASDEDIAVIQSVLRASRESAE